MFLKSVFYVIVVYMNKIAIRAVPKKFQNGSYLLLPATPAEKNTLDVFCGSVGSKYVTVTLNCARGNKTYDQVKTVFALVSLLFQSNYDRKPSKDDSQKMYESLLWDYADREPDLLHPDREVPVHLSRMSKSQASQFINSLFALVIENCDLDASQQADMKSLFQDFKKNTSVGEGNPCDYSSSGELFDIDKWCEVNNVSMASGVNDGTLEVAHIVSKGSHPEYRNCVWNFLRLTHYEHIEIQHRKGWNEFLSVFPHLIPRVKNAFDKVGEIYPFDLEKLGCENAVAQEKSSEKDKESFLTEKALCDVPKYDIF